MKAITKRAIFAIILCLNIVCTNVSGQNVGISDNTAFNPSFMFHLQPSAAYASDLFSVQNNAGTYYFHIKLNGRVGVGTNVPNTLVDIIGGAAGSTTNLLTLRSNFIADNTATGLRLINSTAAASNVGSEIVSQTLVSANGRSDLFFNVHGGGGVAGALLERMRILGSGQVVINGINPVGDVFSVHATTVTLAWAINGYNATTNGGSGSFDNSNSTCGYNAIEGSTAGTNCGVWGFANRLTGTAIGAKGTSNSSDAFGVYGSVPTTGSWLGYGGVFIGGLGYANGLYNLSDVRIKTNVFPIENVIDKVLQVQTVTYEYNKSYYNDNKKYYGLIAQNIEGLFPNAVDTKLMPVSETYSESKSEKNFEVEEFKVIDYVSLIPILFKSIQEQQEQINVLKQEIQTLKNEKNN
jgi:hypothetical protein